jgi:hypothetical protein
LSSLHYAAGMFFTHSAANRFELDLRRRNRPTGLRVLDPARSSS